MKLRCAAFLAALAGSGAVLAQDPPPPPAPATASEAPVDAAAAAEVQAAQALMVRARAEFEGAQQGQSIAILDELVSRLEAVRRTGTLPAAGRDLLVEAYELRARAYLNTGQQEKAAESVRALLQVRPAHALSRDRVSPKVVTFFEGIKKTMVGFLAVSSRPPGATVTVDGASFGVTDFFPTELLAGEHTVEVSRTGYRTERRTLTIAPKATETVSVDLERTLASSFFITEPAGVEVWVDGQRRLVTEGALAPEYHEVARAAGLDPAKASARVELGGLTLGPHVVELKKPCYETIRLPVEVPEARDYEAPPQKLQDSVASLSLTSEPPGGRILVDGQPMGMTPRELERVCSGRHRIEVRHAAGRFVQDVTLARNEHLTLEAPIRPTLAFLGVLPEGPSAERVAAQAEEKLAQGLARLKSLNFVPVPRDAVDKVLEAEKLTRRALAGPVGADPEVVARATEKLAATLEVQGFLIAVLPDDKLQRRAVLHLLAAGNATPDRWEVVWNEPTSYDKATAALDRTLALERPWIGLVTVDVDGLGGPVVLRTVPLSPAGQAAVKPGEVLVAVKGQPVARTADLLAAVASAKPGEPLPLGLVGPGGETRTVDVVVGRTPSEIPLNDPGLLYNRLMMGLRQQVEGYPGSEGAALARLNLGLAALHFGDHAGAHAHLSKARTELPARPGISQGTAAYYLGVALERLGYAKEAAEAFQVAAGFPDATVLDNDGPSVAVLAAARAVRR